MNTTQAAIPGRSEAPRRLTALERRQAWARHRREAIRLVTAQVDWVPVIFFFSLLLSPEARLDIAGFVLFPYRLVFFAALPFAVAKAMRAPLRIHVPDIIMIFACIWMLVATIVHYPLDVAMKSGGAVTFDALAGYFLGRIYFRNSLDFRRFIYRIVPAVIAASLIMFFESVTRTYLFRPLIGAITGHSAMEIVERTYELRNGFLRALGPFQHPIAAGLFFGSLLPLFVAADLPRRRWIGIIACFGGVFGWSSAGIASIFAGAGLGFYDSFQRRFRIGWMPLIWGFMTLALAIQLLTSGGLIATIIRYASFNPLTGYFRIAIFEYGWADVQRHPWFGIGFFETYSRPAWMITDSVDNFWLLQALRYGIPGMVLFILGSMSVLIRLAITPKRLEQGALYGRRMATGLCITLAVQLASIISVAPWSSDMAWLMVLLGMAGGLSERPAST